MRRVPLLPFLALLAIVGGSTASTPASRAATAATTAATSTTQAVPTVHVETVRIGTSVRGRAITATAIGAPDAPRAVVVVGVIHGNETAGRPIVRRLRSLLGTAGVPPGTRVYLVDAMNPDGVAAGDRHDARGVDLNRNFPYRWLATDGQGGNATHGATYYPGPRAASESETRAMVAFLTRVHPDVTIWYHQHLTVVEPRGHDLGVPRAYARAVGLPTRTLPRYHGTATGWQNHAFANSTSFVVELPAGTLARASVTRHVRAVRAAIAHVAATAPANAA